MQRPSVFYKYVSSSTALVVLTGSRLRWSSPLLFNDVTEFRRMPRFDPTLAEAHKLLREFIVQAAFDEEIVVQENLSAWVRQLLSNARQLASSGLKRNELLKMLTNDEGCDADRRIEEGLRKHFESLDLSTARVLCVTEIYNSDPMWGTYAESHTGCVLGFRQINELSTPLIEAQPVTYTDDRAVVGSGLDFLLYGDTSELRRRTHMAVCYTKRLGWSYEQEWRVLTWRSNGLQRQYDDFLFYPEELDSVTLGVRVSAETEAKVREVLSAKYTSAKLYRMIVRGGETMRVISD